MCSNKSLFKRTTPSLKVFWVRRFARDRTDIASPLIVYSIALQTGSRGFGLKAMEDISKGEFVLDYRGEVRIPF